MKRVTFITTGQPSSNPRLVKEVVTLAQLGYDVKVICCFYHSWAQRFDAEIVEKYPGVFFYCGGNPGTGKLLYYFTRLRQKVAFKLFGHSRKYHLAEKAISRAHTETLALAKRIKSDLYIAHNLGALPAAVMAAEHHRAKVGYDAEDMHSGQFASRTDRGYLLNRYMEEKYFPRTDYFTVASPLIGETYHREYPYLRPVTINNVFPRVRIPLKQITKAPVKLFWFSQTVGADRGLETTIAAMANRMPHTELHLLGNCSTAYENELRALAAGHGLEQSQLHFHAPVPPDDLFAFAAQFDIGIAGETATILNRDICLTNKIFVYMQCGLAVVASDTRAQSLLATTYPGTSHLFHAGDPGSMFNALDAYVKDPHLLDAARHTNYRLGQETLNWETEGQKFMEVINRVFSN